MFAIKDRRVPIPPNYSQATFLRWHGDPDNGNPANRVPGALIIDSPEAQVTIVSPEVPVVASVGCALEVEGLIARTPTEALEVASWVITSTEAVVVFRPGYLGKYDPVSIDGRH